MLKSGSNASPTSQGVLWGSCEILNDMTVNAAATYCFALNGIASHCFAVVHVGDGYLAMLELYGIRNRSFEAEIACQNLGTKDLSVSDLKAYSHLNGPGDVFEQQATKFASKCIGGWKDKGYTGKCYKDTMAGLKKWVRAYLNKFPQYGGLTTNCQKFSVGLCNSVTHSDKEERQRAGMDLVNGVGWALDGLSSSSATSSKASASATKSRGHA